MPVWDVRVSGSAHLPPAKVARLANAANGQPWLWVTGWRAHALEQHPWVLTAKVIKIFPGRVDIAVTERVPVARLRRGGREVVIAADGTELPGAKPTGPLLQGWGPDRTAEALQAAYMLRNFGVKLIEFTPSGLTVTTARGTLWSESVDSLRKYARSVTMYSGKRVNIYPWGVSVQK
nr:FtsQ-type POTRA domain-containing protein [Deinobacterium chartae]